MGLRKTGPRQEIERFFGSYFGSALLLLALAGGALWGVWRRDLTGFDTASYYRMATEWSWRGASTLEGSVAFSPLYCAFLGLCQRAFPDPGEALTFHRIVIVTVAALAMLALLRSILPRAWAWLVAAWWVVLPINWGGYFEVHLFGFALTMAACAFAGGLRSAWGRGIALAVLGFTSLLVRNEFLLAVLLFGGCCGIALWRRRGSSGAMGEIAALVAPAMVAGCLVLWLFSGNLEQLRWTEVRKAFAARTTRNLPQVYAFSYKQRHTDWTGDPWLGGRSLLQRDFGMTSPTFLQAFLANPRAMTEHFAWNFGLLPSGLRYALFNGYGGRYPPDFANERPKGMRNPRIATALVVAAWLGGAALLIRWRRRFGRFFLRGSPAAWTWIFLLCCAPPCIVAIATQRPRPSYIFPLTFLLMAFTGLSVRLIVGALRRRLGLRAEVAKWIPAVVGAFLFVIVPGSNWPERSGQPLLNDYRRLKPFQRRIMDGGRTLCASNYSTGDLASYLSVRGGSVLCAVCEWDDVAPRLQRGETLTEVLDKERVTDLYVKGDSIFLPQFKAWRSGAAASGWEPLAVVQNGLESWELWSRAAFPVELFRISPQERSRPLE